MAPPTEDDIRGRARAMVPMLRARAAETEALRRLPDDISDQFKAAGFYKIMQPRRFGGTELAFGTQTWLGMELGRGCGSAAWVATIIACHGWLLGMFPPKAQEEVWGADPDTTVASSFTPVEPKVERVPGGYRVSARWKFSSGVDHCSWAVVILPTPPEKGAEPIVYFALIPLKECTVEDVWHSVGLAGSGSNDIVAQDIFVPEHRLLDTRTPKGGPTPGSAVNDGYLYRIPLLAPFSFNLVGNALGLAQGVAEIVLEGLKSQRNARGLPVAANQSVQLRIAEATAGIEAAVALVRQDCDELIRRGKAHDAFTVEDRVRYRRDVGFAAQLCLRAVEQVFPILGARGLMTDHPVQRAWRDLRAVTHHIAMTWDIQGSLYGAVALGLPCPDPRV